VPTRLARANEVIEGVLTPCRGLSPSIISVPTKNSRLVVTAVAARLASPVRGAMKETAAVLPDNPKHQRIARYNYARAMFELGVFDGCATEVKFVMDEYYEVLGISESAIFMKNPDKIAKSLRIRISYGMISTFSTTWRQL
jgi:hypothetical protein